MEQWNFMIFLGWVATLICLIILVQIRQSIKDENYKKLLEAKTEISELKCAMIASLNKCTYFSWQEREDYTNIISSKNELNQIFIFYNDYKHMHDSRARAFQDQVEMATTLGVK